MIAHYDGKERIWGKNQPGYCWHSTHLYAAGSSPAHLIMAHNIGHAVNRVDNEDNKV